MLDCGRPLTGQKLTAKIVGYDSEPLDFCKAILSGTVVRTSLAEAIAVVAGSDVQRIPLTIEGHYGFEILNTLRIVDCIDEAQSNGGTKIVLDAQRIPK